MCKSDMREAAKAVDIVNLLHSNGANLNAQNVDGNTALVCSLASRQLDVLELLLQKGANADIQNNAKCTALHFAVNEHYEAAVKLLLQYKCNVNLQDDYGDSPVHDAFTMRNIALIKMLLASPNVDYYVTNNRGFNIVHHAALKGVLFTENETLDAILKKVPKVPEVLHPLLDSKKSDGFAPLHISSLNGRYYFAEALIVKGKCDINIRNNLEETPLMLAAKQCHCELVDLLISHKADINAKDINGNTALHILLMGEDIKEERSLAESRKTAHILFDLSLYNLGKNYRIALACFLAKEGADLNQKNNEEKSPLDLVSDSEVLQNLLWRYSAMKANEAKKAAEGDVSSSEEEVAENESDDDDDDDALIRAQLESKRSETL